jgi:two-component system, LytTR family, response regulator
MSVTEPINVIIVDDEALARQRLINLIKPHSDVKIIAECKNGFEAVEAIENGRPDLVFLDVQMPEMNGFEVLNRLNSADLPVVIFVTAFDDYAVKAFEIHALDYLLKPFDRERFDAALMRARAEIERERGGDVSRRLIGLLQQTAGGKPPQYMERISVKKGESYLFLRTDEIDWIEAEANYIRIHVGKDSYLMRCTIGSMEKSLDPEKFIRIHRSTIVKIDSIKEIYPWIQVGEYALRLKSGQQLTISRGYREQFVKLFEAPK